VDVTDTHQRADVGLVGLGRHGVLEKDDAVYLPLDDLRAYLGVPADGATLLSLDVETRLGRDSLAGRAGRDQVERRENGLVCLDEVDHRRLLVVVGDECDSCHVRHVAAWRYMITVTPPSRRRRPSR
jgi:hypothetical protein